MKLVVAIRGKKKIAFFKKTGKYRKCINVPNLEFRSSLGITFS